MVRKDSFQALNVGYLTKAMLPAFQNIGYTARVYMRDDHNGEDMFHDEVVQ